MLDNRHNQRDAPKHFVLGQNLLPEIIPLHMNQIKFLDAPTSTCIPPTRPERDTPNSYSY